MNRRRCCTLGVFFCLFGCFLLLLCPRDLRMESPSIVQVVNFPIAKQDLLRIPHMNQIRVVGTIPKPQCSYGKMLYDRYCVLKYLEVADWARNGNNSDKLTLTTQSTPEFLHHLPVLCKLWQGPISLAVYCSGKDDIDDAERILRHLKKCDHCVNRWVDCHLFYDVSRESPISFDQSEAPDCSQEMKRSPRRKRNGSYPINVGRNIARQSTSTPYVFPIDIELYPSHDLRRRFELMLELTGALPSSRRQVYVLPIFEVWSRFQPPKTKFELRNMFYKKQAISFHKYRCNICHRIPDLFQWMNYTTSNISTNLSEPLSIWRTVKRNKQFGLKEWEPFFIGTREDPLFDTRLSWEGKANKMQVAYEMCLLDYDFHILNDAFLVHAPGVNIFRAAKEKFRSRFVSENFRMMRTIKKELLQKYGRNPTC